MATSYKNKIYTTLGTPTNITTAITPLSVSNSSGVPVKDYTVKGRSIVWNQLVKNGNFVDTTGWSVYNGTGSASNNKYTFTVSGTQTYANVLQYMDKSVFVAGHKYYVTATITPQYSAGRVTVALHNGATIQENLWIADASSGKTNFVSTTFTISSNFVSEATTGTRLIFYCPQTESVQGNITVISNAWMVDLTKMFGAGNEPNLAQFRALFPDDYYEYDAGTIKSIVGNLQLQSSSPERYQLVNKANFPATSTIGGNITVTNNGDGSVTFNGTQTTTKPAVYVFDTFTMIGGHKYLMDGVPATGGGGDTFGLVVRAMAVGETNNTYKWDTGSPVIFTGWESENKARIQAIINADSITNITFAPQLFDLTAMFGRGNEPTTPTEFWQKVTKKYYPYNPNAYKSVNIPVETYFPDGFNSVGNVYDEISFSGQTATRRIGVRSYQDGDENESSVLTDGTNTLYVLSTPTITNIPKKLQALPTYKGFTSFSFPNSMMQNGPFDLTYYAEGGTNPEKGWITTYKRKIYTGKMVEWNQILSISPYATNMVAGVAISKNRNKLHLKGTATSSAGRVSWKIYVSLLGGHKYYAYKQYSNLTGPYLTSVSDTSKFFNVEMFTCDVTGSYAFGYNFVSGTSYDEDITVMLFDLTQMFGAGNEPSTPAEFWQYFDNKYYPYNKGETQPLFLQSRKAITEYTITNTQNKFIFDVPDAAKSATILGWGGQSKVINGVLYDGGLVSVRIDGKNLITPARDSFTVTSSGGNAVIDSGETMKNIAKNSTTKRNSSYLKIDTVDAVFNPSSNNRVGMESNYSVSGELKYSPSVWITGTSFLSGTNNDVQAYRTTVYSSDYEEASTYNPLICYVQGLTSGTVTTKDFEIRENKAYNTIPTDIRSLAGYGIGIGDVCNSVERQETGWHYVQRASSMRFTTAILETASETGTTTIDGKTVAWARNIQFPDSGVSRAFNGADGWANISSLGDVVFNGTKYNSTQFRMFFMNYSSIEDVKTALGTDGVLFHYQIATPVVTDISDKIADSFLKDISVIPGGKVVMYNKYSIDVASTVKWKF